MSWWGWAELSGPAAVCEGAKWSRTAAVPVGKRGRTRSYKLFWTSLLQGLNPNLIGKQGLSIRCSYRERWGLGWGAYRADGLDFDALDVSCALGFEARSLISLAFWIGAVGK